MSEEAREAVIDAARAIRERERADNLMRFTAYARSQEEGGAE